MAFELKWNRFVNTKGTIDGNVELDRHLVQIQISKSRLSSVSRENYQESYCSMFMVILSNVKDN